MGLLFISYPQNPSIAILNFGTDICSFSGFIAGLVLITAVGTMRARRIKTEGDFAFGGRNSDSELITGALLGTLAGGSRVRSFLPVVYTGPGNSPRLIRRANGEVQASSLQFQAVPVGPDAPLRSGLWPFQNWSGRAALRYHIP